MARGIVRKVQRAAARVNADIARSIDRTSKYSSGLAYESFKGGYLAALNDVLLVLNGVEPNDGVRAPWWED